VLAAVHEELDRRYQYKILGYDLKIVAEKVSRVYGIEAREILSKGRQKTRVEARSLLCCWAVSELGMSVTDLASTLRVTPPTVSYAARGGEAVAEKNNLQLFARRNC
jgi:putative transposase